MVDWQLAARYLEILPHTTWRIHMSAILNTNGAFGIVPQNYVRQHARDINARYDQRSANILSPRQRFNSVLAAMPAIEKQTNISKLKAAIKAFQARFPTITQFNDPAFRICRAIPVPLSLTCIDTTIQRYLDIDWVIKIIENFTPYQAMPVQMYQVNPQDLPEDYDHQQTYYAAWDGQHTLVAFWVIATMIFQQQESEVIIPMVAYDMRSPLECRMTFIQNNGKDGKKVLSPIDLAMQQIYGVRLDGVTEPSWATVEQKQAQLEKHDLFLTDSKFHDDREPGAITRTGDVMDPKITVEQIRQFGVYADHVLNQNPRAVNTKELPIILGFLRMASDQNYTDEEIQSLADLCMQLFDADFSESGPFWAQVNHAYVNWHNHYYADMDEYLRPHCRLNKDWAQGGTFFWYQLRRSWRDSQGQPMRVPQLNIQTAFQPAQQDLF
jgi:hypothetical protein